VEVNFDPSGACDRRVAPHGRPKAPLRDRLDRFLADPQAYVPGTKMKFAGIQAPDQRRRLIEFLASGANNNPPPEDE